MKYAANIIVLDDQGNIVYERDLSADEIIDELLLGFQQKSTEGEYVGELAGVPVYVSQEQKSRKKVSAKKLGAVDFRAGIRKAAAGNKPSNRTCGNCRQPGHNAKTCGRAVDEESESPGLLTESEYDQVKESQAEGVSSKDVADDLGLSHEQVNFAFAAPEYSLFVHHMAARQKGYKN